ncbi:hypothetical protein CHS0354_012413 [Potamilus streckersoni]|uniref:Protein LLP homolog n=1 Tax=Potamilus streckersoni TaxID=2493646 RepID=A0AAE0VVR0_9BIVA|nr:hypothetical protein CHS0354_012413 [Potamilus streckersoni]
MAKSLRSKWKRKMRNVRREKFAKKELEQLKKTVAAGDSGMTEMKEIYTVKTASDLRQERKLKNETGKDDTVMEVDKEKPRYNPKTLKDEHGHYPVWMNQRRIKKLKSKRKHKNATW